MRARAVKPFLLAIAAGVILVLGTATPAEAASPTPCWKAVINDWFDGRLDQTYPTQCYQQALHHLPQDVDLYSSAKDDIERALLASLRQDRDAKPTFRNGGGSAGGGSSEGGSKSLIQNVIEWLGPSNAESVPLPLLILAGVAFLLLAAAGGSFVNRRLHERRMPPPQP